MKTTEIDKIQEAIDLIQKFNSVKKARQKATDISEKLTQQVLDRQDFDQSKKEYLLGLISYIVNRKN